MANPPKVASRINLANTTTGGGATIPVKPVVTVAALLRQSAVTPDQVTDPVFVAREFTELRREISDATLTQRSHPEQAPITFQNVTLGAAGTKVLLAHNFGRFASYIVTKWKGSATVLGPSIVCDEDDGTTATTTTNYLGLRSYVAGIADIRVF